MPFSDEKKNRDYMRAYMRKRRKGAKRAAKPAASSQDARVTQEVAALRARIAELEAALAAARAAPKPTASKREEKFTGSVSSNKFTAVLARADSDNDSEALTCLRKAQQMLKANGLDWHAIVAAVDKAELFKPTPKPNAREMRHVRDSAAETLKMRRWLTESEQQFLQQLIEDPLRYGYEMGMERLRIILTAAHAKRSAETRAKRAAKKAAETKDEP